MTALSWGWELWCSTAADFTKRMILESKAEHVDWLSMQLKQNNKRQGSPICK